MDRPWIGRAGVCGTILTPACGPDRLKSRVMPATSLEQIVSLAKAPRFRLPVVGRLRGARQHLGLRAAGRRAEEQRQARLVAVGGYDRDDMEGLDAAILMNRLGLEVPGDEATFSDPMTDCRNCKSRPRADHVFVAQKGRDPKGLEEINAAIAAKELKCRRRLDRPTAARPFNLMFRTTVGAGGTGDDSGLAYLRPETAQGIFVDFGRAGHHAPQAAVRRRPDRQGVPQRDHARQLHLPHARVRADGDRVLRRPVTGCDGRLHQTAVHPWSWASWLRCSSSRGKVAYFEACGLMNIEAKTPMTKDALFRMASSSQPVTGVAIMMLVEEGKVRLSGPVHRFIPEFKGAKVAISKGGVPAAEATPAAAQTIRDA